MLSKKSLTINHFKNIFSKHTHISLYQDNGLSSQEWIVLQQECKSQGFQMEHVKNSFIKVALQGSRFVHFSNLFEGPSILIYGNSTNQNILNLYNLHNKHSKLCPIGGIVNDSYISSKQFNWITSLETMNKPYLSICNTLISFPLEILNIIQAPSHQVALMLSMGEQKV